MVQSRFQAGIDPLFHGARRDPGALIMAKANADLILFDHRQIGRRRTVGPAQQRLHRGKALVPGFSPQCRQGLQPPPAGNQAIAPVAQIHHLDRSLLAAGADRGLQRLHLFGVVGNAVADKMIGLDGGKRQALHQAAFGPGRLQFIRHLAQCRHNSAVPGDLGDRGRGAGGKGAAQPLGFQRGQIGLLRGGKALAGHGSPFPFRVYDGG